MHAAVYISTNQIRVKFQQFIAPKVW